MTTIKYPDWLPDAVKCQAEKMLELPPFVNLGGVICRATAPDFGAVIHRMATAPEMKKVWRRLQEYPPNMEWIACLAAWRRQNNHPRMKWLVGDSTKPSRDDAMRLFFESACELQGGLSREEIKKINEDDERRQKLAAQLREENESHLDWPINGKVHDGLLSWVLDGGNPLLLAAEILENQSGGGIKEAIQGAPRERDTGLRRERTYAVALAEDTSRLFIFPDKIVPHTLIATVTKVRFDRDDTEVNHKKVGHWLKAHAQKAEIRTRK
jgi:hypothetical protein